jgi:hypothetical protein
MRNKQKLISVVGGEYINLVVLDLLSKSFGDYKIPRKDFFQIGHLENTYSNSGIILTVASIESYMSRLFHHNKELIVENKLHKMSSLQKYLKMIALRDKKFNTTKIPSILAEIFILRDTLMHNHIYDIELEHDGLWNDLSYDQTKVLGGDKKFNSHVDIRKYKTKLFNLNVQPLKIGFEELFISLVVYDLFIAINRIVFKDDPFHLNYNFNSEYENNLSEILSYYHSKNPNDEFKIFINKISKQYFKIESDLFVNQQKSVTNNYCPFCGAFGFYKTKGKHNCAECGEEIIIGEVTTEFG